MDVTAAPPNSNAARSLRFGQHLLFALLLVIALLRVNATTGMPAHGWAVVAFTVGWYFVGYWGRGPRSSWFRRAWLAILVACWLGLTLVSVEFSWLGFPIFLVTMGLLPLTGAVLAVTFMTIIVVFAQLSVPSTAPTAQIIGPVVGAVVAVGIGLGYRQVLQESRERGRLLAELMRAQDELAEMHAELAAVQRRRGVLDERGRLARDLHDTLAQGFSSILLLARAGTQQGRGADAVRLFEQIGRAAEENLSEVRNVVRDLTPEPLQGTPLLDAVQRLLGRLEEEAGIRSQLLADDVPPLPTTIEVALLRFLQGALANVRTHSRATTLTVTFSGMGDGLLLDVVDDGVGFNPQEDSTGSGSGFGLRAMTQRLAEIGAKLTVESEPGSGTALAVEIPSVVRPA